MPGGWGAASRRAGEGDLELGLLPAMACLVATVTHCSPVSLMSILAMLALWRGGFPGWCRLKAPGNGCEGPSPPTHADQGRKKGVGGRRRSGPSPSVTLVPLASAQPPSPIFSTFPRGKVFPPRPPGQLGLSRSRLARPSPRPCRAPRPAAAPAASPHTPAVLQCTPQLISRLPLELLALPPTTHSGVLASCASPTFPNHYMLLSDKSYSQQITNHNKSF